MKTKGLITAFLVVFSVVVCHAATIQAPDGAILYYEVKGEGPPILFLHGWTMSGKFWQKQVDKLSKDFMVIVMDLRAHGNSSKVLHGHTMPQYAKDVRTLIETLGLRDVTLVGWSLAGPVVLEYWQQFGPDKLRGLGLVDITPFPFSPAEWNTHGMKNYNYDAMNGFFIAFSENRREVAAKFINNMFKSGEAPKADTEWMMAAHLKTPTPVGVAIYSDYLMRDYSGTLKTITVPAIVFAGDSNIFKKGIEMGKYISSQIQKSQFVPFEKAGHMPFYEDPDKFNEALANFVKGSK